MTLGLIVFFVALGFLFLLIEVLITPGIIVGAIGIGFMSFGVYKTYEAYGSSVGNIVLISVFLGTILFVFAALKSGVWDRMASKDSIQGKAVDDFTSSIQIGDKGKAISALRPTGTGYFNGIKMEVNSEGEAIEAQSDIEVVKIRENKIIVKKS
jgi:membrane-bound ClpP family serine protease